MAEQFSYRITGVAEATGELKAAMLLGIAHGLEKVGLRGVQLVDQHTPVGATGNLIHGVFAQFHQEGPVMHEVIAVAPPAEVYAGPVETGTRPHFPPFDGSLLLWVQKKEPQLNEKQARSLAFLIARKISKKGTQGAHMFELAFQQLQQEAPGILEQQIAIAVEQAGFGGKQ